MLHGLHLWFVIIQDNFSQFTSYSQRIIAPLPYSCVNSVFRSVCPFHCISYLSISWELKGYLCIAKDSTALLRPPLSNDILKIPLTISLPLSHMITMISIEMKLKSLLLLSYIGHAVMIASLSKLHPFWRVSHWSRNNNIIILRSVG